MLRCYQLSSNERERERGSYENKNENQIHEYIKLIFARGGFRSI